MSDVASGMSRAFHLLPLQYKFSIYGSRISEVFGSRSGPYAKTQKCFILPKKCAVTYLKLLKIIVIPRSKNQEIFWERKIWFWTCFNWPFYQNECAFFFLQKLDPNQNQWMNTGTDTDPEVRPVPRVLADLNLDPILQPGFLSSYFWILFYNPDSYLFTSVSDSTVRILVLLRYIWIWFYNPDSCIRFAIFWTVFVDYFFWNIIFFIG